ncbi:MAG: aminopeptidase YwaD [Halobacteriales archaeon]|jgi:aminopeptidase YwaD
MTQLPEHVIGDAYTDSVAWDLLSDLVAVGNRMAGQSGEHEGAGLVADAFADADLRDVEIDEFEIPGWWRGDSSLAVAGERPEEYAADHDVIALPGTPSGTGEGELVDVGHGTEAEFEDADLDGKIAMARSDVPEDADRWRHRMEKYADAYEAGADGFVFRNHVEGCLPPTGEIGYHDRPGPIPAVGVSKELGERLARKCEGGDPTATLQVECRNEPATSRNVEGVVGPDTDEEVLVTAHVDAHDIAEGANDNGAGSALVAEVGRLLARAEDALDTRVRLITFGSEEIGLYGAYHWAETHDLEDVKAVINVDGAGNSRTLRVGTNGFETFEDAFEAVTEGYDAPLSTDDTVSPHGDQWPFVQEGVPAVMASTTSEGEGRGWGHTHADTLDKLDPRDLRDVAIQLASAAVEVTSDDRSFERKDRAEIENALSDGYVRELKVGGRWPYGE